MVDILAFGAHPDDVELSAAGTLIKHIKNGYTVGIVDLTLGEMGTRGSKEIREKEAYNAMEIIGAKFRENLLLPDAFIEISKESISKIVHSIRKHRPALLANKSCSFSFNFKSITFSHPFLPMTTGTPIHMSFCPYSPSR